ncbi:hypothetical protein Tco_0666744 [Tanacetum coccineum]
MCYSFKSQKEYRPVSKKLTANSSGNKKKCVEPTIEVSNSNPLDVLNSVDNDVEFGSNGGTTNLGEYDSGDEVASVDNDMARSMASERVGFGTQCLLEQWRDSYGNGDYDDDPYDNDMYEGQDLSQDLQALYDNLDIPDLVMRLELASTLEDTDDQSIVTCGADRQECPQLEGTASSASFIITMAYGIRGVGPADDSLVSKVKNILKRKQKKNSHTISVHCFFNNTRYLLNENWIIRGGTKGNNNIEQKAGIFYP